MGDELYGLGVPHWPRAQSLLAHSISRHLSLRPKRGHIFGSELPMNSLRGWLRFWDDDCSGTAATRVLASSLGAVAQLVRAPDCRSGGCGFDSRRRRFFFPGFTVFCRARTLFCANGVSLASCHQWPAICTAGQNLVQSLVQPTYPRLYSH